MNNRLPSVLIGTLSSRNPGAIPIVTRAFMEGLEGRYRFIPYYANRKFGVTKQSGLSLLNLLYLIKHLFLWSWKAVTRRPDVAHYPVTSYWNMEKSLIFLGVARLFGAKTVGHLHGGAFIDFWNSISPRRRKIAFERLRQIDAFVVLSHGWKQRVEKEIGLDPAKVMVVYNPIDREFEDYALAIPVQRPGCRILSLGVMSEQKGVFDILEAAPLALQRCSFDILLAGPEREPRVRERCRELMQRHNLASRVAMREGLWGEEKRGVFRDAVLFLLPSYYENFPLVVLEAAAAGLPIITTPIGAVPEFFEDRKSVLFVEPGNVKQIADAIAELMMDPSLRNALGTAAREVFVSRLSRVQVMHALDNVYRNVLHAQE